MSRMNLRPINLFKWTQYNYIRVENKTPPYSVSSFSNYLHILFFPFHCCFIVNTRNVDNVENNPNIHNVGIEYV